MKEGLRPRLNHLIYQTDTKSGRVFDLLIQILIWASLAAACIETFPTISADTRKALRFFEYGVVAIFTLEYLLRIAVTPKPLRYITSFYGIIDLLAILPFYLQTGTDLRALRIFRVFRALRAFKLLRYSTAMLRFQQAFVSIRNELAVFLCAAFFLLLVASLGIYSFENEAQPEVFSNVFDAMWWCIVTMTTVGYGDAYPITLEGRMMTGLLLVIGLGVVAVPTGLIAAALTQQDEAAAEEEKAAKLEATGPLSTDAELAQIEDQLEQLQLQLKQLRARIHKQRSTPADP